MLMHYIYLQIKFMEKKLRLLLQNFNLIVCEVITLGKGTKHMCSSAHLLQWKACITTVGVKKYCCHQLGKPLPGSFYFSPGSLLHVLILNTIGFLDFELYVIDLYSAIDNVWRRQWQPTPVLSPGKSHGRRSLVGSSPLGREESDTTERLHFNFSLSCTGEGNGNPLQCSCLENPRDWGACWVAVSGVAQSRTRLKWLSLA